MTEQMVLNGRSQNITYFPTSASLLPTFTVQAFSLISSSPGNQNFNNSLRAEEVV